MKNIFSGLLLIGLLLFVFDQFANAQDEKQYEVACVAFYNLENLFDTIDDPKTKDDEFTPGDVKNWNGKRYNHKLDHMAEVISQLGTELTPDGPAIVGVCELENKAVLQDLINREPLKKGNYQIVHYESPYYRGMYVALLYQSKYFKLTNSKSYTLSLPDDPNFNTRDQLLVSGKLNGEMIHFIVNHWPSRRGGEKRSRPKRIAAAKLCRSIADSVLALDKNAKIIIMGDLNDDPTDPSVKKYIKTTASKDKLSDGTFFNPTEILFKNGIGSLAYRDNWNLFDQIILSPALVGSDMTTFKYHKAVIFNKSFLTQKDGRYKGYPMRTYSGGAYTGGYSDHFPSFIYLIREVK